MDLVEQLRNQIRRRTSGDGDVLQAIAQGVKEELASKYIGFEFTSQLRAITGRGFRVELVATRLVDKQSTLVFKIYFEGNKCILRDDGFDVGVQEWKQSDRTKIFVYEHPDMLDQLYQAIDCLSSVPHG